MNNEPPAGRFRITVLAEGKEQTIEARGDTNLLVQLQAAGLYLPAICGGRGSCGKCKVRILSGSPEITPLDKAYFSEEAIQGGCRLACAAFPREALTLSVPEAGEGNFAILNSFKAGAVAVDTIRAEPQAVEKSGESFARRISAASRRLSLRGLRQIAKLADMSAGAGSEAVLNPYVYRDRGKVVYISREKRDLFAVALDIGTTTIAMALVNLQTGQIPGRLSVINRQREFGADVISRIQRANAGDLDALSRRVRAQISEGVAALCRDHGVGPEEVCKAAIAGNTTMVHLLLNLSCNTLGQYPFTPVTLDAVTFHYNELFEGGPACETTVLPGISTYVGADIAAGLLFSELHKTDAPVLFMDIGTNGEMALALPGKITCTATAAGPAFEGGTMRWGTGSVPGAISRVRYRDGRFEVSTIDDRLPTGICGSGVVDAVYQALKHNLVLKHGGFNRELGITGLTLAKNADGEDIQVFQKDIRELQLAKSAICSGVDALLHQAALRYEDIKTLYIAGGFGYNLDFESGAGIGLIPQALAPKVALIGNSALGGAVKYLLDSDSPAALDRILDLSEEFNLAEDKFFQKIFIENINFYIEKESDEYDD
ncbi:MAG: ASKHA domain-containing protein [Spirochaetaceae bacterium]|nr:ASKHA domain-containing protein [Spirochaetaceae bacterium]